MITESRGTGTESTFTLSATVSFEWAMARAFVIARPQRKSTGNIERKSKEPPESMFLHFVAFTVEIHIFRIEF